MCKYSCFHSLLRRPGTAGHASRRAVILALQAIMFTLGASLPAAAQGAFPVYTVRQAEEFEMMAGRIAATHDGLGYAKPLPRPMTVTPVSADELRHPLTEKAAKWLRKAWIYATKGDHAMAISTLKEGASKVREFLPYSHGLLGIEYLRTGNNKEAVPELTEAANLFPHDAAVRSNLALSLCLIGDYEHAEREVRVALYLEPTMDSAEEIMRIVEEKKAQQAHGN